MTFYAVNQPFQLFYDLNGNPLENGYIWIGEINQNPITHPITITWDANGLYSAAQPVRTLSGYANNNGSASNLYIDSVEHQSYSILIKDKNLNLLYSSNDAKSSFFGSQSIVGTISELQTVTNFNNPIYLLGYSANDDGGEGYFIWDATDHSADIIIDTLMGIFVAPYGSDGSSGCWVRQYDDIISPEWFGAKPGEDSTDAFKLALIIANGRPVVSKKVGHFIISDNIDNGYTGDIISISGATPVNELHTHLIDTNSTSFEVDNAVLTRMSENYTVIECQNCNFVGATDTVSVFNASAKLKQLSNFVIYGTNDAEIGIHVFPVNTKIHDIFIARFGLFGLLTRSGITSSFKNIGFDCNGFNLPESGSATGASTSYGSGCNFKVAANTSPMVYNTIVSSDRPTTFSFKDIFCISSDYYTNNNATVYSGLRALQIHGILSGSLNNVGGYQGAYFVLCTASLNNVHFENYCFQGLTSSDNTPISIYAYDSRLLLSGHFLSNQSVSVPALVENASGSFTHNVAVIKDGIENGKITSVDFLNDSPVRTTQPYMDVQSTPTGGGTTTVTFSNVIAKDPTKFSTKGFAGLVIASLSDFNNINNNSQALYFCGLQFAGSTRKSFGTSLSTHTTLAAGFSADITSIDFDDNGNLLVDITWGTSWNNNTFRVKAGLLGTELTSSH